MHGAPRISIRFVLTRPRTNGRHGLLELLLLEALAIIRANKW